MFAEEMPDSNCGIYTPQKLKGVSTLFHLYVNDADKAFSQAVAAGAKIKMPLADMFWGDRYGQLEDPYGYIWAIASHVRDVSDEEIEQAGKECMKG